MVTRILVFLALMVWGPLSAREAVTPDVIIPRVASYTLSDGSFTLAAGSTFSVEAKDTQGAEAFCAYLESLSFIKDGTKKAAIRFKVGPAVLKGKPEEAYVMTIGKKGISVEAAGFDGAFYAVQSLLQMLHASEDGALAACRIEDVPRFRHRGLMLDVSRHFQSKDFILKQLDAMALIKMNRFHFHITDNQGWRIALDCAPEMVQKAAFGSSKFYNNILSRMPIGFCDVPEGYVTGTVYDDGRVYGGYYSKDDIREIVDHAAALHITVVPEIELPGHNRELLHVHPEFYCDGKHVVDNVFCAGNDEALRFFERVLEEVMELFPSQYIHIGGDEADKDNWAHCSLCRERMKAEGLKDEFELQSYVIRRIDKFVSERGRRIVGWDEILQGGLSDNATVMSWRGTEGGIKAMEMDHDVIMSPNTYYYFDYGQDAPYKEPIAFRSYLPLETVYNYDPEDMGGHLLGVQANLWTECVIDPEHCEHMFYPRAYAVAETGWSPAGVKDYGSFRRRALILNKWLMEQGYHCFDLEHEAGERPEALRETFNLAKGAGAVLRLGDGPAEDASILVDGYLGKWDIHSGKTWKNVRRKEFCADIDLGCEKEIHYLGAEFVDYPIRGYNVPADTEFYVSSDGVNYTRVDVPQARLSSGRKHFQIYTVGSPVSVTARYIRLIFNTGSTKVGCGISEILVS